MLHKFCSGTYLNEMFGTSKIFFVCIPNYLQMVNFHYIYIYSTYMIESHHCDSYSIHLAEKLRRLADFPWGFHVPHTFNDPIH